MNKVLIPPYFNPVLFAVNNEDIISVGGKEFSRFKHLNYNQPKQIFWEKRKRIDYEVINNNNSNDSVLNLERMFRFDE
jgi:hypothetical protein